MRCTHLLAEDDLAGTLGVNAVPAVLERDDRAHRLARRVEGEDLDEGLVGVAPAHGAVVLAEVQHEAEQRALRLVADLLRLLVRVLRRLKKSSKFYWLYDIVTKIASSQEIIDMLLNNCFIPKKRFGHSSHKMHR